MKSFTETEALFKGVEASKVLGRTILHEHFDRLLAANGPALMRLASSFTDTRGDRDDLLQEIAMALWQALPSFRGDCSERTFLFRIAHNRAVAHLARTKSLPQVGEEIEVRDPAPDPEAGFVQGQRVELLRRAIRALPLVYRHVITLSLEGLGYLEIAEVLGISESNVGVRLTRARQELRMLLEKPK